MADLPRHQAAGPAPPGRTEAGTEGGRRGSGDDCGQKLVALRERLLAEAGAVRTAGDWARCLRTAARLPGESFANILLIQAQRPGATLVQGYEAWRAAGRQVGRGEPGIEIFFAARGHPAPAGRVARRAQEPEPAVAGWREASRVARVWDISQTSGPAVHARAALPAAPGGPPAGLWDGLCWLARRAGFAVEREQGAPADGVTFWTAHRIRILPGLGAGQAAWALAHQLGHVLMHDTAPRPPGQTTSGAACTGIRKADADAVAFIICARYGITVPHQPDGPGTWAGTDPRAQPAAAVLAAGERITAATTQIIGHLDRTLPGQDHATPVSGQSRATKPQPPQQQAAATRSASQVPRPVGGPPAPDVRAFAILDDAAAFYAARLSSGWAPGYLTSRGISQETAGNWRIGYAPAGWAALTDHLLAAGYADQEIEAAGLARRSSRGTLIDHFRDRVMLPVCDAHGRIAGFTGRARPGHGPAVPKYLNSPQTSLYRKSDLLFGLAEARVALAAGAVPVIVEGPFDAIAVTIAAGGHYAGLAPCGTALTARQAALLGQACDLARIGALVAFDPDQAGRKAAIRAYGILRPLTPILQSARLDGRDPAQILEEDGAHALRDILTARTEPLLGVIVDGEISRPEFQLRDAEGPFCAMRAAAVTLAGLLPADAAAQVRRITAGAELAAVDDQMRPVIHPQLRQIARALPADIAREIMQLADRLGFTSSDVVVEVANAVTRQAAHPGQQTAARLAAGGFPGSPVEPRPAAAPGPVNPRRTAQPDRCRPAGCRK